MKLGSRKRLVQSLSAMCHKFNQRTSKKRRATQLSDVIISFRAIIPFKISSFTPPRLIKISSNSRHEEKVNPSRIGKIELARGRRIGISFAQNPFLLSLERIVTKAVSSMVIPFPSFRSNFIGYKIFYESSVHLTLAIVSELNGKYRMKFHYNKIRPIIQALTRHNFISSPSILVKFVSIAKFQYHSIHFSFTNLSRIKEITKFITKFSKRFLIKELLSTFSIFYPISFLIKICVYSFR